MNKIEGFLLAVLASALVLTVGVANAAGTYKFTALGTLGGPDSFASDVNKSGVIVGSASDDDGTTRPVTWNGRTATALPTSGSVQGGAADVNDAGVVVGSSAMPDGTGVRAMMWRDGQATDLGTFGGDYGSALAINKVGTIVGFATKSGSSADLAAVWRDGKIKSLPNLGGPFSYAVAISDAGHIAGYASTPLNATVAVVWKDGRIVGNLGEGSRVNDINASGVAVGGTQEVDQIVAARWDGSIRKALGCLPAARGCEAFAINGSGVIVGRSFVQDGSPVHVHATLWEAGQVIDLNDRIDDAVRQAGWVLEEARAINVAGKIVGLAQNTKTGAVRGYVLTPRTR
jgi:probable HAF family extracellular repeat protein